MALDVQGATAGTGPGAWNRVERRRGRVTVGERRSPERVLGPALVQAVLRIVRTELEARLTPAAPAPTSRWLTPPVASRLTRVPVKTIRAWARDGRIPKRLKNRSAEPKQQKYLVNVDDVVAAAERIGVELGSSAGEREMVRERAREILEARAARTR